MGDELREQVSSLGGRGVAAWRWRRLRNTAGCCTQLPCAQLPCLLPHMQAIDKFKLCYVRYQALLAQLHAAPVPEAKGSTAGSANGIGVGSQADAVAALMLSNLSPALLRIASDEPLNGAALGDRWGCQA